MQQNFSEIQRFSLPQKWWLPLGIFVSVLLHVLVGLGVSKFSGDYTSSHDEASSGQVYLRLAQTSPHRQTNHRTVHRAMLRRILFSRTPPVVRSVIAAPSKPRPLPPAPETKQMPAPTEYAQSLPPATNDQAFHNRPTIPAIASRTFDRRTIHPTRENPSEIPPREERWPDASPSTGTPMIARAEAARPADDGSAATLRIETGPPIPATASDGSGNARTVAVNPTINSAVTVQNEAAIGGVTNAGIGRGVPFVNGSPTSDTPLHIVYVIDISGSMEDGNKIGRVQQAVISALRELRPVDMFNIVLFSDRATLLFPKMGLATRENTQAAISLIDKATPNGATNLSAALEMAFAQPEVTHIVLLSDGEPVEGITDFDELLAFARQKNASNARILTMALGRGEMFKGMTLLQQLAEQGQGTFRYIDLSKP